MAADRTYVAENGVERERLGALVRRLSDEDLRLPLPGGWTVAALLVHAAFWDARAIAFYDAWLKGSRPPAAAYEPDDTDWVNDAFKPLCLALEPREAARLAVRLAEEADRTVAALDDDLLDRILAAGPPPLNLARATHRREHLDDIEQILGG